MVAGVVWSVLNQLTGGGGLQAILGFGLFLASQAALIALAFALRNNVRDAPATGNGYQLAWRRLTLGLELTPALKLLRKPPV